MKTIVHQYECKTRVIFDLLNDTLVKHLRNKTEGLSANNLDVNEIINILLLPIKNYCQQEISKSCANQCNKMIKIKKEDADMVKIEIESDIRNHLTVILSSTEILETININTEEKNEAIKYIKSSAFSIAETIEGHFSALKI